jgi:stringent starvation protein B
MPPLPAKKDVLLVLLERSSVFVHLDPRDDAVRVPSWFKKQPELVLQIGLNMAVPIRDLSIDDDALSGTLSFSRTPHFCYMPWRWVYALIGEDSRGMVWPEDIPPEVVAAKAAKARSARRPKLRAVPGPDDAPADESEPELELEHDGAARSAGVEAEASEPEPRESETEREDDGEAGEPDRATPDTTEGGDAASPEASGGKARPPYLRVVK